VRDDGGGATTPTARPRVGIGDAFDLGGEGNPLDLHGEHLVTVAMADGSAVPDDLYLRSGFYQVPGLDSWQVGALAPQRGDDSGHRLRAPTAGVPVRRLQITLRPDAHGRVFVPAGVCAVVGAPALLGDPLREWVRAPESARLDGYAADYQDPPPGDEWTADPRWDRGGLLELPAGLDAKLLQPLLDEFRPAGTPWAKATAIARGLQARCRYELREPIGTHGHALLNFLHGDRTGFCMHFASATALLLRMSGVACRIGVGLFGGRPAARGQREYGSQHAHAWVEIPVLGRGWVAFDPTPPAQRGAGADAAADAAAPPDASEPDAAPDPVATQRTTLRRVFAAPWPYALLLAAFVLPLHRRRRAHGRTAPVPAPQRPARRLLARILRTLATRGHPRPPGATLEQFAAALARAARCPAELPPAFAAYQEVRFGGRPFDALREQRMAAALTAVRALPPPAQRVQRPQP
jgi:transglutaminase-like putative cysteine protease